MDRAYPESYFIQGMLYYETYFAELRKPRPYFLVDTDDRNWVFLQRLKKLWGPRNVFISPDNNDFRPAFHRMVMADGFISAESSFSRAAVMLRDFRFPIITRRANANSFTIFNAYISLDENGTLAN